MVTTARHAEETLQFWMGNSRSAIRSYINHEPVEWPEQAIAEHNREQRERAKVAAEAAKTWSAPSAASTVAPEERRPDIG